MSQVPCTGSLSEKINRRDTKNRPSFDELMPSKGPRRQSKSLPPPLMRAKLQSMVVFPGRLVLALVLAPLATNAVAADYVVVRSSDPTLLRGQAFDAGARLPLAAGSSATLMHASGDVVTLVGADGGISLPRRVATAANADRLAIVKFILARKSGESHASMPRTRGGICPPLDSVTTLDAIAQVYQGGCAGEAAAALDAFLASAPNAPP